MTKKQQELKMNRVLSIFRFKEPLTPLQFSKIVETPIEQSVNGYLHYIETKFKCFPAFKFKKKGYKVGELRYIEKDIYFTMELENEEIAKSKANFLDWEYLGYAN